MILAYLSLFIGGLCFFFRGIATHRAFMGFLGGVAVLLSIILFTTDGRL